MNYGELFQAGSLVWPLTILLILLIVLKALGSEVKPIFSGMRDQLALQASKNAMVWAMAMMMGLSASNQSLIDVSHQLGWFYVEAMARVVGPGLIAVIALLRPTPVSSTTTPPFPKTP